MKTITQFVQALLDIILPVPPINTLSSDVFLENARPARPIKQEHVYAVFAYKSRFVRDVVHALKYKGSSHAAKLLATGIQQILPELLSDIDLFGNDSPILLVPIPLSKKRSRQRGYNQAKLLTESIVALDDESSLKLAPNILIRSRNTLPQTDMKSRKERLENVRGCFEVSNSTNVRGKNIIVIDDVTTTGATLNEARRALLGHGASSVICIAAAH